MKKIHCILNNKLKIGYIRIPKCACSCIKQALYKLKVGKNKRYQGTQNYPEIHGYFGQYKYNWHTLKQLEKLSETYYIFTVVRDPVKRLMSAYRHLIRDYGMLPVDTSLNARNLQKVPDINYFVEHLEDYRKDQSIKHHTDSQAHYVGQNIDYITEIFNLSHIKKLESKDFWGNVRLEKEKHQGKHFKKEILNKSSIAKIKSIYAEDYKLFGLWKQL